MPCSILIGIRYRYSSRAVDKFTDLINIFIPGESKGFLMEELEMAKKWVSGS